MGGVKGQMDLLKLAVALGVGKVIVGILAIVFIGIPLLVIDGLKNWILNKLYNKPLLVSAKSGDKANVEAQLAAGVAADLRDPKHNTALHFAAYSGHLAVVSSLLAARADKNARNKEGQTPLYLAEARHHLEIVSTLLAAGAEKGSDHSSIGELSASTASETTAFSLPNGAIFEMIFIPAGTFWMGSPENEPGRNLGRTDKDFEKRHQVTLSRGFQIEKYPVTRAQWQAVMGDNPSEYEKLGVECPVDGVSGLDCQDFIRKLNALVPDGRFRLPTEAEWEYACRAGTEGDRYGALTDIAWYRGNSNLMPHPVGLKEPNNWGLYDMIGNVEEWCADLFMESLTEYVGFYIDPKGARRGFMPRMHPCSVKGRPKGN